MNVSRVWDAAQPHFNPNSKCRAPLSIQVALILTLTLSPLRSASHAAPGLLSAAASHTRPPRMARPVGSSRLSLEQLVMQVGVGLELELQLRLAVGSAVVLELGLRLSA